MSNAISDLNILIATLSPRLNDGVYSYCLVKTEDEANSVFAVCRFYEAEGITLVVKEDTAIEQGWPILFRCAWITLDVHADLSATGLVAAFTRVLADRGISCNVLAATHHEHLFVPAARANDAMQALHDLQQRSAKQP